MPALQDLYRNPADTMGYNLLRPPTPPPKTVKKEKLGITPEERELSSSEKLRKALTLVAEVRTDDKIREQGFEDDLAFVQDLLTSLTKGESIQEYLPQPTPERETLYTTPGEMTTWNGNVLNRVGGPVYRG